MEKMLSIIIPFYNAEKFLDRTLNSFYLNEINHNLFEIILVNDGSTDGSSIICNKYLKNKSNIVYIECLNGGVSSARNKGIDAAQGKYITFVDADDYVSEEYIRTILNKSEYADYVIFDNFIDNNKTIVLEKKWMKKKGYVAKEEVTTWICNNLVNAPWDKIFKADIIKKNNIRFLEGLNLGEDVIFNLKYAMYCDNIYISSKSIYFHTINDDSLTNKIVTEKKYKQYHCIYSEMVSLLQSFENNGKYIQVLNICYLKILYNYIKQLYKTGYSKKDITKILESEKLYSIIIRERVKTPSLLFRKIILKLKLY